MDLNFEVVNLFVFAFGHVNGKEVKWDIFLEETGQNPGDGSGERRAIHFDRRRHGEWYWCSCEFGEICYFL